MTTATLTLTGTPDSLPDYEFELKSFNCQRYSGRNSTYNFQVPYDLDYITEYVARPNGEFILYFDGVELLRANPDSIKSTLGTDSSTIGFSATKQITNSTPKTVVLTDNVIKLSTNIGGLKAYTVAGYIDILPADSVTFNASTDEIVRVGISFNSGGLIYTLSQ